MALPSDIRVLCWHDVNAALTQRTHKDSVVFGRGLRAAMSCVAAVGQAVALVTRVALEGQEVLLSARANGTVGAQVHELHIYTISYCHLSLLRYAHGQVVNVRNAGLAACFRLLPRLHY